MKTLRGWTVAAALAAVAIGCDSSNPPPREVALADIETEIAEVVCGAQFDCGCPQGTFYESASQCEEVTHSLANEIRRTASDNGLTWDPACLGAALDVIAAAGCDPALPNEGDDDDDECTPPCNYLFGTASAGAECQYLGANASNCAQGLQCQGVCVDPCGETPSPTGSGGLGDSCFDRPCAPDLVCNWMTDTCVAIPEAGQACPLGVCVEGAFCELEDPNDPMTEMVCKAPYELGEPCRGHSQCESGYCPAGFCDELPAEGESCRGTFVCAPGLDCVEEVCQPGAPAVCDLPIPLPGL